MLCESWSALNNDPAYHADPPELRQSVALGELTAIYHRPSGQTHVVTEPVPAILDALSGAPLTLDALLAHLDAGDDQETRAGLSGHLDMLLATGLVWKCGTSSATDSPSPSGERLGWGM